MLVRKQRSPGGVGDRTQLSSRPEILKGHHLKFALALIAACEVARNEAHVFNWTGYSLPADW